MVSGIIFIKWLLTPFLHHFLTPFLPAKLQIRLSKDVTFENAKIYFSNFENSFILNHPWT